MLFLVSAFLCSAMVSIVLKIGGRWEYDEYGMFAVNYAACLVPFSISQMGRSLPLFDADFMNCVSFAAINGFLYLMGMVLNRMNVRRNGAILQSAFARLGVMVPICLSIVLFGERPMPRQIIGIAIVLAAFCIMNIPEKSCGDKIKPEFGLLLLGLLFGGIADSFLKVFQEYGQPSLENWFMGITFLTASLICLAITALRKGRIGKTEIILGLSLGIPNYLSSLLLLRSLSSVSAYIAYPTYSVGAILTVIAVSAIAFRERITKWSRIGVLMIIPAVLLLNL